MGVAVLVGVSFSLWVASASVLSLTQYGQRSLMLICWDFFSSKSWMTQTPLSLISVRVYGPSHSPCSLSPFLPSFLLFLFLTISPILKENVFTPFCFLVVKYVFIFFCAWSILAVTCNKRKCVSIFVAC